ncbi:vitelline membrane outer layer protein 1 homolog [Saccostrea cucullata]|uniref:vitelline membrane outer layer protein 1 homolog n=1 Tax=Saccostrea cuccullata TaxID=36930 RepID=UPI002ED59869
MQGIIFCIAASLIIAEGRELTATLEVKGGDWGLWGDVAYCPEGSFADGYKMKIEPRQFWGDDTSLNRVAISCRDAVSLEETSEVTPHPHMKAFGSWGSKTSCHEGDFLTSFALQVEKPQGKGDDTAANFLKFTCRNTTMGEPYVLAHQPGAGYWGTYGEWSETCPQGSAICGIQQKIESYQSIWGDDTELNNLRFFCCKL